MSRRPRLLLLTPPYHAGVVESAGVWMPLGFVYVAGHARAAGAEVELYDAMSLFVGHDEIERKIEEYRPDIIGIMAITAMEPDAREICKRAKRIDPTITTVIGHVHATFCWQELLERDPNVDILVRGEGEHTIAELVQALAVRDNLEKVKGISYRRDGAPYATPTRPFAPSIDAFHRA